MQNAGAGVVDRKEFGAPQTREENGEEAYFMRYLYGIALAVVLAVAGLTPAKSDAAWHRWSSGYYTPYYSSYYYPAYSSSYYYPSTSYYYSPGVTTSYYVAPGTTYVAPAARVYYNTPSYSSYYRPYYNGWGWYGRWR